MAVIDLPTTRSLPVDVTVDAPTTDGRLDDGRLDDEWLDDEWLDGPDGGPRRSTYPRCSDGAGTLAHLFFADTDEELARAKAICRSCGLAESCLAGAIERGEAYGVWGGELVIDGVVHATKPRRGRPPTHPRPVLVVDEVPLPHQVA